MPAASPVDEPVEAPSIHELLERMLSGDAAARQEAWFELLRRGYAALTVIDEHCTMDGGGPLHIKVYALNRHLRRFDSPDRAEGRGLLHTPTNTHFGDPQEDDGYGPARGRGGAL